METAKAAGNLPTVYSEEVVLGVAKARMPLRLALLLPLLPLPLTIIGVAAYIFPYHVDEGVTFNYLLTNFCTMAYPAFSIGVIVDVFTGITIRPYKLLLIWVVGGTLLASIASSGTIWGIFPLPFAPLLAGSPSFFSQILLAYFSVPADVRRVKRAQLLRALFFLAFLLIMSTGWMVYRAVFVSLTGAAQAASILILPIVRFGALLIVEKIVSTDVDTSGSKAAPVTFAIEMYNAMFNASLFTDVANPANAALIVLADMAGTLFYFALMLDAGIYFAQAMSFISSTLCCRRKRPSRVYVAPKTTVRELEERGRRLSVASATADEYFLNWQRLVLQSAVREEDNDTLAGEQGLALRWKLRISAFLLMEEFVELLVPLIMMCVLTYQKLGWNQGMFPQIASMSMEQYFVNLQYLAISFCAEAVLFACTGFILWKKFRINLFHHLSFLLQRYKLLLLTLSSLIIMFIVSLNSSFTGIDFTFQFKWIHRA
eukprot:PLAT3360.3.p1 GENE.PLAT3360.3~~PLAT3360.3.p1  ORF type:complete len:499 (-),score=129.34 PLAT3360.3:58-1515(-)